LIVLPRFFEAGVDPIYALWLMITDFKSLGIIFGLIAWCVMLALLLTSFYKDKLNMTYTKWRLLHIILSAVFLSSALWHVIDLGRHMNEIMISFIFLLVCIAVYQLGKLYFSKNYKKEKVL
jgi:DMSO/TMAO reductase YedYZ heme-binding membrane subunit